MATAYLNRIATATPANDVHAAFNDFAGSLLRDPRAGRVFQRMASRSQIEHRWSSLMPAHDAPAGAIDQDGFYTYGRFPSTAARMQRYEQVAPDLAAKAVERLELGGDAGRVTHLIVVSCTGVSAPGLDFDLVTRFGLKSSVERTMVAFMGCYAAINGLKLARHIVRSEPEAKVLLVCLELCTLHLKETDDLEQVLTFSVFGDGCAAALVSGEPAGLALESFHAALAPGTADQISWTIRDLGFDMVLAGTVPTEIGHALRAGVADILVGRPVGDIDLWAVHPGGRSVLDAVETGLELAPDSLADSREVLRANGNMSSATILFVLQRMMRTASKGLTGCAMAFGPGLVAETMMFRTVGR